MAGQLILLVDDDADILDINRILLTDAGYNVETASSAEEALAKSESMPDLVVLDLLLPDMHGLSIISSLRSRGLAVLVLSALSSVEDRVIGLRAGGDDYLVKPYALSELLARVESLLRRAKGYTPLRIELPGLMMDLERRDVYVSGTYVRLTRCEFELLLALARRPGALITIDEIQRCIWHEPEKRGSHLVMVHMSALRKKLSGIDPAKQIIQTEWGKGYRLVLPDLNIHRTEGAIV